MGPEAKVISLLAGCIYKHYFGKVPSKENSQKKIKRVRIYNSKFSFLVCTGEKSLKFSGNSCLLLPSHACEVCKIRKVN